jgi:phage tail sheath protein FI
MATTYSYPGVYIEEVPSGVRTIVGVSTSDTAFIDFFPRGRVNEAVRITSFGDFVREFGGLDSRSEASYAIQQYYLNGGSVAWVVRVTASNAQAADRTLPCGYQRQNTLLVQAANPGGWGNHLQVAVDRDPKNLDPRSPDPLFNLVVREVQLRRGRQEVVNTETHRNLSIKKNHPRYAIEVVKNQSSLIRLIDQTGGHLPEPTGGDVIGEPQDSHFLALGVAPDNPGGDGYEPMSSNWRDSEGSTALRGTEVAKTGMYALTKITPAIFNILCIPAAVELSPAGMRNVYVEAAEFCKDKRAFLIVDIPSDTNSVEKMTAWMNDNVALRDDHAAVYFPGLLIDDPLNELRPRPVGASGTLAGVYARTDATRGVWKAPAGIEATLRGARLAVQMTDLDNGALNPQGINALRSFPIFGNVSWGARTLEGADQQASEYKYIPVRRTALYIEESLYQGLKWVVFEPNDEPLWAQIRLNVGAFMNSLFRQGAFQGKTAREAYFVKCDKETTTQNDIDRGIVNILVGFAPLKPAEFVVVKIQQIAGQLVV